MQKTIQIKLAPSEAANQVSILDACAKACGASPQNIKGFQIIKKSIDARARQTWFLFTLLIFINELPHPRDLFRINFRRVSKAKKSVAIVGAGPAGLFAAMRLLESGIRPVILERGKNVRDRRRDLATLNKEGILNPDSNYCFGEGGAGTYSDGKLYTRSTKRGDVQRILNILVQFGAEENILYDAHPHIGTNKLPGIITAIRQEILGAGGQIHFEKKVIDFKISKDQISGIITEDGDEIIADAYILATGHSARDIFLLLEKKKIEIEFKPFAIGVRIEHPQQLIDSIQYTHHPLLLNKQWSRSEFLPPASYGLVEQVRGKGVFSFCMCPGGIIAAASTAPGELVVNGWSPSKRNNPYANSGIVVSVEEKDIEGYRGNLAGMYFQQAVEKKAFLAGGGKYVAPAQRMVDFVETRLSSQFPDCSYLPGIHSAMLKDILPEFVFSRLARAFIEFGKKMKGYYTQEAVILATESRTSSPVRIPRDKNMLSHPQIRNLYPCGEGAGYAGGIVSAAMDGERIAAGLVARWS
jgi:uncharacterized FAD-dependent dehydrogenase